MLGTLHSGVLKAPFSKLGPSTNCWGFFNDGTPLPAALVSRSKAFQIRGGCGLRDSSNVSNRTGIRKRLRTSAFPKVTPTSLLNQTGSAPSRIIINSEMVISRMMAFSQCWRCDAHGCNCSAKNQLRHFRHDFPLRESVNKTSFVVYAQKIVDYIV